MNSVRFCRGFKKTKKVLIKKIFATESDRIENHKIRAFLLAHVRAGTDSCPYKRKLAKVQSDPPARLVAQAAIAVALVDATFPGGFCMVSVGVGLQQFVVHNLGALPHVDGHGGRQQTNEGPPQGEVAGIGRRRYGREGSLGVLGTTSAWRISLEDCGAPQGFGIEGGVGKAGRVNNREVGEEKTHGRTRLDDLHDKGGKKKNRAHNYK